MAITIQYERPFSRAAHWSRRLAAFAFVLSLVAVLSHRFGPLTTQHLLALGMFAAATAGLAVMLAAVGLWRLWHVGAKGGKAAFVALLLALLPLGLAGAALYAYFYRPAVYDVTTDRDVPPSWLKEPVVMPGWPPRLGPVTIQDREVQRIAYPGLTGRRYDGALDRVLDGARKVAEANGVVITVESGLENVVADLEDLVIDPNAPRNQPEGELAVVPVPLSRPLATASSPPTGEAGAVLLQGEWRSLVIGFRFDVMIRMREESETTLVDLRVASRYGPHDLGIGAAFADQYLKALDAELLGIAGD